MVSLWGSKNGEEHQQQDGEDNEPRASGSDDSDSHPRQSQADERSRLLPPPNRDGYLHPDDPAVSPYNLWSVRALRYFSLLFLMITFLWWALLLVSIFVSPPQMNSRGSGFFDFSYTTLTLGNLMVSLLFFATPSTAMGILSMTVSALLLIDMIIILAVSRLRLEEGWIGIASVIWAAFIGLYNVLSNRTVSWGKKEEEERLTGREESRRSLREWCAVFIATAIMSIMVLVTILLTATLILRSRDASLAPPGERFFVDGDKYQVHLACVGNQTYDADGKRLPTVMLEGGEECVEESFVDWVHTAYENGTIDRYCYWDRPGMAWSDNAPSPHSAGMSADALSEALAISGEQGPWILLSAGIGSIYSRVFSARHVHNIAGIMMVDPLHEDLLHNIGEAGRGFVLWGRGIIAPLGLDRLAGALFKGRTIQDRVYGKVAYQNGKFIKNKLQENLVADSLTKSEVAMSRNIQIRDVPLVIVSSGVETRRNDEWQRKQEDLTKITDNLLAWDVVNRAPHLVWKTDDGKTVLEDRLGLLFKRRQKEPVATPTATASATSATSTASATPSTATA